MQRYWLFAGSGYYALGGMRDFIQSYPGVPEAVATGQRLCKQDEVDWWHVLDSFDGAVVSRSKYHAYGDTDRYPGDFPEFV